MTYRKKKEPALINHRRHAPAARGWVVLAALLLAGLSWARPAALQAQEPSPSPPQEDVAGEGATQIQGAVIIAHLNQDVDFSSSEQLQPYLEQLRKIFGYDVYRLEEQTTEALKDKGQVTQIETRPFSVAITWLGTGEASDRETDAAPASANPQANMHRFKLQIFQKGELIVETEVRGVTRNSPFYIRGPEWGRSQIIFMILVSDSPAQQPTQPER